MKTFSSERHLGSVMRIQDVRTRRSLEVIVRSELICTRELALLHVRQSAGFFGVSNRLRSAHTRL